MRLLTFSPHFRLHVRFSLCLFLAGLQLLAAHETCQSTSCKAISDDLQNRSMNSFEEPCDDFYEYICGNYQKSFLENENSTTNYSSTMHTRQRQVNSEIHQVLIGALNSTSVNSETIKKIAQVYRECIDTASRESLGVLPLLDFIEQTVGDWPMLRLVNVSKNNETKITSWEEVFVNVYSKAGLNYIFDLRNELGSLMIKPGWTLIDKLVDPATREKYKSYDINFYRLHKKLVYDLSQLFGVDVDAKLLYDIEQVAHLEYKLVKAYLSSQNATKREMLFELIYNVQFTHSAMTRNHVFKWQAMMLSILNNFAFSSYPFSSSWYKLEVSSSPKTYVREVFSLLAETPLEVVQNYFAMAIALEFGALTTSKLRATINEVTHRKKIFSSGSREECISSISSWPVVIDRLYVDSHFTKEEKLKATLMVEQMRATFRANLVGNGWLDESTKKSAIEKLDALSVNVGYYEWIFDDEAVDEFHRTTTAIEQVDLKKPGGFFNGEFFKLCAHYYVIKKRLQVQEISLLMKKNKKKTSYDLSSATVNAYYNVLENSITIPAGILKPPFFDHKAPPAMNYGSIGSIIGHELTHCMTGGNVLVGTHDHFDNSWWSEESVVEFHSRARCFVEQYGEVLEEKLEVMLDGKQTLIENIADNAGLKDAYEAFQLNSRRNNDQLEGQILPGLNFTAEQLFFVSHAKTWCEATSVETALLGWILDSHSPNKYRVNVALGNFDSFSEAFQCPLGSRMNPVHKCAVW